MMKKIFGLVVLVLLLAVFFFFFLRSKSGYSAVYLESGDLYFGRVQRFPTFGLRGVVSIQPTQDEKTPLVVTKFTNLFWGPQDFMRINREKVVWIVDLSKDGQLATVLRDNPNLLPAPQGSSQLPRASGSISDEVPQAESTE